MDKLDLNQDELYALQLGRQEPFDKIFMQSFPLLCDYIKKLSKGELDGEDIAQEIFIKFHRKRTTFKSVEKIMAYLYKACDNAYFNYLKHKRVKRKHIQHLKNSPEATELANIETEVSFIALIAAEIEKLPDACRDVFKLLYYERLSNQEVAERLNISDNNVATQKRIAIQRIRKNISNNQLLLMALLISIIGLKLFPGSFSYSGGLVVHQYIKPSTKNDTINH